MIFRSCYVMSLLCNCCCVDCIKMIKKDGISVYYLEVFFIRGYLRNRKRFIF